MHFATELSPKLRIAGIALFILAISACSPAASATEVAASPTAQPFVPEVTQGEAGEPTEESPAATDASPPAVPSLPNPDDYEWVTVAQGFAQPLLVTNAGDGSNRLFVLGQQGLIYVVEGAQVLATPFLDVRSKINIQGNEQGLLGLAFHPDYAGNGAFYLNYTDLNGDSVVARYQVSSDPNVADPASEQILLQVDQPYANHNGGHLLFGPDGYLYIGLGDGGSGGDPGGNGQSLDTHLGKLLRIDVNAGNPYGIPADNPFAGSTTPEIWAYGLRNPWRFTFDALSGDLYIGDVGQGLWEEIDFLAAGSPGGANFGWNFFEGSHSYQGEPPDGAAPIAPVAEYDHGGGRCSVTGGSVYRGSALPAWQGVYLYGDFCSGEIFGLAPQGNGEWQNELLYDLPILLTSFGEDESGEMYLLDRSGVLYRLQAK